jgi:magnesium transporter
MGKEVLVGLLLGTFYGAILGGVGYLQFYGYNEGNPMLFAFSVGIAAAGAMVFAASVATLVPMVFARVNIDPAVATGPFVTTSIDIIGVTIYFNLVTLLL